MYRSMSFELKCAVNSVALKLMLAPLISYSLPAVAMCKQNGSRDVWSSMDSSYFWGTTTTVFAIQLVLLQNNSDDVKGVIWRC